MPLFPPEQRRYLDLITNSVNDYLDTKWVNVRHAKPCLLIMSTYLSLLKSEMRIIFNEKSSEVYNAQVRNEIEKRVRSFVATENDCFKRNELEIKYR